MFNLRKCLLAVSVAGALGVACTAAASPITFASGADYDNGASQTTGVFRDFLDGVEINRGLDLGGTGHNALNFTGSDSNSSPLGRVTLYDTTPATNTVKDTFTGDMSMSADILISRYNNGKGAGLVTLFNEGVGKTGLALFLQDGGNTDGYSIKLVQQTGVGDGFNVANLSNVSLGSGIAENTWYRLTLSLDFTGPDFSIIGKVFGHTTATDPNSALGAQIVSTLTYTDTAPWTGGLSDPYEIGLVARGVGAVVDTSVTNFAFSGGGLGVSAVPEPGAGQPTRPPPLRVVDVGGLAKAATRLHLSQPALSRQIQALEAELGVALFDRVGRRVQLTSQGEDLLLRSRRLLAEADALGERARELKSGDDVVIKVLRKERGPQMRVWIVSFTMP
jgi:hypothetical protein